MKKILLICFAFLNININAAVITQIINNSDTEVTFGFCNGYEFKEGQDFSVCPKSGNIDLSFNFPSNDASFRSLLSHKQFKNRKLELLEINVPNYLKIKTKLGMFYLAYGNLVVCLSGAETVTHFAFWKQQLGKEATKTMGKSFVNIIIVIDSNGDIQFFEDRPEFEN